MIRFLGLELFILVALASLFGIYQSGRSMRRHYRAKRWTPFCACLFMLVTCLHVIAIGGYMVLQTLFD